MRSRLLLIVLIASPNASTIGLADEPNVVDFTTQIKPLLEQHCVTCHRAKKRESGLRLDLAAEMLKGGDNGQVIVAEKPDESLLYTVLLDDGDVSRMPYEKPPLAAKEIALVRRWIVEGAKIPQAELARRAAESTHWSFQPVRRSQPPRVPAAHADWVRSPIDEFIVSELVENGIAPSPAADRRTLIRRLSLDLLGLLPTPDEVERFVTDDRPDAYERLVDRLLASPHYGERWGRHWLDLARYADSNGFTIDGERSIWPYRDWVIDAVNANQSFDEFVIDQLAGDLRDKPTRDQLVATGFHRNTLVNQEGGTDAEQFRVEAVVDRVNTTGSVFLGLTVGCAQCHTHKYDPITQREFYELLAFFNNTEDVKSVAPTLPLANDEQLQRQADLRSEFAAATKALKEHDERRKSGRDDWAKRARDLPATNWSVATIVEMRSAADARLNPLPDGAVFVGGDGNIPNNDTYTITLAPASPNVTAVRLETPTYKSLPKNGPGLADNGNFVLTEFEVAVVKPGEKPRPVKIERAVADWSQQGYPVSATIDQDRETGWAINVGKGQGSPNVDREAVFTLAEPLNLAEGERLVVDMRHDLNAKYLVGSFRLSTTSEEIGDLVVTPHVRGALEAEKPDEGQRAVIAAAYGGSDTARQPLARAVDRLKKELADIDKAIPTTMILRERAQPRETHVMIRGDFLRKGDRVEPDVPEVLPAIDGERRNRLTLAEWLVTPDHPLVARVTVNRYWQRFFGRGLVETENDFGTQGTPPSHPELLDWLASEFVRTGWDVKRLHRTIVTSATYRQSSRMRPDLLAADPANKLLARQSRVRLEAEAIRDVCLSASGLLTPEVGGPSVHPPQPGGIRLLTQVSKSWPESQGPDRYRRGMYTFFWRSNPYPFLLTFDAPRANTTCTRRVRSNTPLQSLTLANDRTFVEFARGLAERILDESSSDDTARIRHAVRLCFSREPTAEESKILLDYVRRQRTHFASHADDAKSLVGNTDGPVTELAAWTSVARVLMNLDEFITRN